MTKFSLLTIADPDQRLDIDHDSLFEPFALTEGGDIFSLTTGRRLSRHLPELPCLALIARQESHLQILEQVQDRFRSAKTAFVPDVILVDQDLSFEGLLLGAAFGMETFIGHQSELVSQLSRDLYELRREHDKIQDSFSRLEDYFYTRRVSLVEEYFVTQPQALVDIASKSLKRASWVRQVLPMSSKTLSAFALHVGRADRNAKGALLAVLNVPELGQDLWSWRLELKDLAPGWLQFGIPETLGGIPKSALLNLRIEGEPGQFRLSVGGINPLELYQLSSSNAAPIIDRSLALRLFISPPGMAVRHDQATCLPVERNGALPKVLAAPALSTVRIARDLLPQVRRLSDSAWAEPDFETVVAEPKDGTLLIHPARQAPTVALLANCIPVGACAVEADIFVGNPKANVVAFRLGLVRGGTFDHPLTALVGSEPIRAGNLVLSEWAMLGPGRQQSLSVSFGEAPLTAPASLVFVTRMADGAVPDFAWARFAELRFQIP